ncbi:unnamed protein product [Clonostachys rhizophaga]|uniref:Uncharacterized protein n=1 Tax=Clonostachys rhizophaga TaxID=160324 RepID=A0A9N9V4P9_9HYPO|nr:unnamed protein product [Clonostachys rhizophaga]
MLKFHGRKSYNIVARSFNNQHSIQSFVLHLKPAFAPRHLCTPDTLFRNMSAQTVTAGRILISLAALTEIIGPYAADWNESHVFNPRWPPHAHFHNGQTLSMGLFTGLLTLFYLWKSSPQPPGKLGISKLDVDNYLKDIHFASVMCSIYYTTGMTGEMYPNAWAIDPEFGGKEAGRPQVYCFYALFAIIWGAYRLEQKRVFGLLELKGKAI